MDNYWLRHQSPTRLSRRKFVKGAATGGIGAAGLALVGCGDDDSTPLKVGETSGPTPSPAASIVRGGTMTTVWETEPIRLDPHHAGGGFVVGPKQALFEGFMLRSLGKLPIKPLLAESWEAPDNQTFTFKLRDGVKFHDGTAFDADVAKWNFERTRLPTNIYATGYLGSAAGLTSIVAVDSRTLRATFDKPRVGALSAFQWRGDSALTGMVSRVAADKLGAAFGRSPVGTGPFKFKQWDAGRKLVVERFLDYWGAGEDGKPLPYLDTLEFVDLPELAVAVGSITNGDIHAVVNMGPPEVKQLTGNPNVDIYSALASVSTLFFNPNKPPFDDVRLRKAVVYGIKRDEIAKLAWAGKTQAFSGGLSPDGPWQDPNFKAPAYDPNLVHQLLSDAGVPGGFSFKMAVVPRGPRLVAMQIIQAQLKEFGIQMEILLQESADYAQDIYTKGELNGIMATGSVEGLEDIPSAISGQLTSFPAYTPKPAVIQYGQDLVAQAQSEFDPEKRKVLFWKLAQWHWVDYVTNCDIAYEPAITAVRHEYGGSEPFPYARGGRQTIFHNAYKRKV